MARTRDLLAAVALALAIGCGDDAEVVGAEGEIEVSPPVLVFGHAWVGHPTHQAVRVHNTGRTEQPVSFAITGPFRLGSEPGKLAGAADLAIDVHFEPQLPGEHAGELSIDGAGGPHLVRLAGFAERPDPCPDLGPCVDVWFDPAEGTCHDRPKPEGGSCVPRDPCLVDGICREGVCQGVPRNCDDGNRCTSDACDPSGGGCLHQPLICNASGPCKEAWCDPDLGCREGDSIDGKRCGSRNCQTMHVCASGACEAKPTPDGTPCNGGCGTGECRDQVCFRELGEVMETPWRSPRVPAGTELFFPGLVDADGRLVWYELRSIDGTSTLVVAEPTGDEEVPFAIAVRDAVDGVPAEDAVLVSGDLVVAVVARGGERRLLEARTLVAREAGEQPDVPARPPVFRLDVAELLPDVAGIWEGEAWIGAAVDDGEGLFHVVGEASGAAFAARVDRTGRVESATLLPGWLGPDRRAPVIGDAGGDLYLALHDGDGRHLLRLRPDGSVRWAVPVAEADGDPVAVADGRLVLSGGAVRDPVDGALLFDVPGPFATAGGPGPAPVIGAEAFFAVDAAVAEVVSLEDDGTERARADLAEPGADGLRWSAPLLTAKEHALLARQAIAEGGAFATGILEIRPDGTEARSCVMPDVGVIAGGVALPGGYLVVAERYGSVVAFPLVKDDLPASSGWPGPGGLAGGRREVR